MENMIVPPETLRRIGARPGRQVEFGYIKKNGDYTVVTGRVLNLLAQEGKTVGITIAYMGSDPDLHAVAERTYQRKGKRSVYCPLERIEQGEKIRAEKQAKNAAAYWGKNRRPSTSSQHSYARSLWRKRNPGQRQPAWEEMSREEVSIEIDLMLEDLNMDRDVLS